MISSGSRGRRREAAAGVERAARDEDREGGRGLVLIWKDEASCNSSPTRRPGTTKVEPQTRHRRRVTPCTPDAVVPRDLSAPKNFTEAEGTRTPPLAPGWVLRRGALRDLPQPPLTTQPPHRCCHPQLSTSRGRACRVAWAAPRDAVSACRGGVITRPTDLRPSRTYSQRVSLLSWRGFRGWQARSTAHAFAGRHSARAQGLKERIKRHRRLSPNGEPRRHEAACASGGSEAAGRDQASR